MTSPIISTQAAAAASATVSASRNRRILADRLARYVFVCGGWIILLSICAILLVISLEILPLLKPASYAVRPTIDVPADGRALIVDDYLENAILIDREGTAHHVAVHSIRPTSTTLATLREEATVASVAIRDNEDILLATEDGLLIPGDVSFKPQFRDGVRTIIPAITWQDSLPLFQPNDIPASFIIQELTFAQPDGNLLVAVQTGSDRIHLLHKRVSRALMGPETATLNRTAIQVPDGTVTTLALDERADYLVVGTDTGKVYTFELRGALDLDTIQSYRVSDAAVTKIRYALGGRTVLIGDALGTVQSWLFVRHPESNRYLMQQIHTFKQHEGPVHHIEPSQRDKVFVTSDIHGTTTVHHATTGNSMVTVPASTAHTDRIVTVRLAPRSNAVFSYSPDGTLSSWDLDNPHPEISWKTLFAPVHYEGYSEPAYVWQSSGGTDTFEPKLSLVPLIFGTMKGTLYALLFSVPLALLAAFYASQFMSPGMKSFVKPLLEIMAALPSVVIGFIAGLWLAPVLEPHLIAIFCMPVAIILGLVATCLLHWKLKNRFGFQQRSGIEMLIAIPVVAGALAVSFPLAGVIEAAFFGGNFTQWLYDSYAIRVDQRNSIIAGIAVGFAVIPIIFTIADDCLSSVPKALSAGSLALGATRWQTALHVVFPVAAPGIFAAVMIGLGRAVGETMIVLMATGNTPLIDLSAFTGFRALSANIAVELPEAPQGGTLYRVLFLTAFILFVLTFFLNTLSEFVRSHLKKKYGGI